MVEPSTETQVMPQTETLTLSDSTSEQTIATTQDAAINDEVALDEAAKAEVLDQLSMSPTVELPPQASTNEIDSNLIDIINSMESDRQKFIAHVRSKISNQETEFEVSFVVNAPFILSNSVAHFRKLNPKTIV